MARGVIPVSWRKAFGDRRRRSVWLIPAAYQAGRLLCSDSNAFTLNTHRIIDPLLGSGTTGVSCRKFRRDFVGVEILPETLLTARARIAEADELIVTE